VGLCIGIVWSFLWLGKKPTGAKTFIHLKSDVEFSNPDVWLDTEAPKLFGL
jgi:hypothetical protein